SPVVRGRFSFPRYRRRKVAWSTHQRRKWRGLHNAQRPVDGMIHRLDELLRQDPDDNSSEGRNTERKSHRSIERETSLIHGLPHKYSVCDAHVVVEAEDGVKDAQRCQNVMSTLDQAEKDEVLAVK